MPTVNPDGWDRAEEGLCSGQVQGVPCLMLLCHVRVDVSFGDVSYVLFPETLDILFCCGKKLHDCYFTFKKTFQMVVILLLRTSTVDD